MKLAGWIMTGLFVLFMLGASATPKFLRIEAALESMEVLGWSPDYLLLLGVLEVVLTILFVIPRTSFLGAILLMSLFGGAMASHLRVGNPLFSHTLFPVYLGVFMWASLWLRDERLRSCLASFYKN
jgi:DoxX-like family